MLLSPSMDKGHRRQWAGSVLALAVLAGGLAFELRARTHEKSSQATPAEVNPAKASWQNPPEASLVSSMGLRFEPNRGQTDAHVKFLSRNSQYNLFLTNDEAVFALNGPTRQSGPNRGRAARLTSRQPAQLSERAVLRMQIVGAHPQSVSASEPTTGHTNYFIGRDARNWVRDIPQYSRVNYQAVYSGVDMTFYGNEHAVEFDLIVKPGADPSQFALHLTGARKMRTTASGDLILTTPVGDVSLKKPVAYQIVGGDKRPVAASFEARHNNDFGIRLGAYDRSRELVVDPAAIYSTYFGGSGADAGHALAVDGTGAVYVTGQTSSADFPTTAGAAQSTLLGTTDAFVTKFNPSGSALIYSTYLGGSSQQGTESKGPTSSGNAIVIDGAGNAYIAGGTNTSDFPLCPGANNCPTPAQGIYGGGTGDAFAVKVNATGGLAYSTFIGGSDDDVAEGIAIDPSGNIYVGGQTASANLTTVQPLQATYKGMDDGFVAMIDGTGGSFKYLDYLGGTGADLVTGIGLDQSHNIYVTGITISTDFPVRGTSPYQSKCGTDGKCNPNSKGAEDDSFVTAIKSDHSQYIYSTYFGGSGADDAQTMLVDPAGDVYFTGLTSSTDLVTVNPYVSSLVNGATNNVFVAELAPTGSTTPYVTYLGGTGADIAFGIALDSAKRIYLTGQTVSTDFPVIKPIQKANAGQGDAFVSLLDTTMAGTQQLVFSTYLGGVGAEDTQSAGVAVDSQNNIYVTGDTASGSSGSFPVINAYQSSLNGASDAFLAKISPTATTVSGYTLTVSAIAPSTISVGSSGTSTVTVASQNGFSGSVNLTCKVTPVTKVPPTCTFASNTLVIPANGTAQTTLTVGTVAPTSSSLSFGSSLPIVGFAFVIPGVLGLRRRQRPYFLAGCLALTALLLMPGCVSGTGTSGGGTGSGTAGTTTGMYQFTVTGNSLAKPVTSSPQTFTVK
jgi:hypothetical protein